MLCKRSARTLSLDSNWMMVIGRVAFATVRHATGPDTATCACPPGRPRQLPARVNWLTGYVHRRSVRRCRVGSCRTISGTSAPRASK